MLSVRCLSVCDVGILWPVCCGQTAGWIKMPLDTKVGLGQGDIVLDGDPSPPIKGDSSPHFLTHVYCGQTAGWNKMPLATEVGIGPGHIVLDGTQLPHPKRGTVLNFRPMAIVAKRSPISAIAEHL